MNKNAIVFACLTSVVLGTAFAQVPKMEPGPAQEKLDFLVGEWTVRSTMHFRGETHEHDHKATIRWLPGGVWLEEAMEMPGTPIGDMYGTAHIAWDAETKEYVRYWIDNQSHVVLPMRGRFAEGGTLEFRGSFEWVDGTVYHQRLVIRDTDGGWTQTGYMGTDPEDLRLNHEGEAVRVAEQAATMPPAWFEKHMAYMTRGSGRWVADNTPFRSDSEPFDAYVTEWTYGPGRRSMTGRLHGTTAGEPSPVFWEFRLAWHPVEGRVVAQQFGIGGAVGSGPMIADGPNRTKADQTFQNPDGSQRRVVHESHEVGDDEHVTRSFDVGDDGTSTPRRKYTWKRSKEGPS